ncbi:hypothetical protein [Paenibacillus sp. L3-i20]|uniref:hypothetical protein n=1 Tax=Paenibacillus sp. L3-i20 TaxID=2905833 RepID=UPI001EDCA92D|nr:hypothetical protein [Paenibacillus sp. L3-i20]GKU79113.1 hypothetical protein L3i20_v235100 [Paenibacillus sp. L3-i20]
MRTIHTMTIILVLAIITIGCSSTRPLPLTKQEVNNYIVEQAINEVAVEMIGEIAVILFIDEMATGYHLLYKDDEGVIQDQKLIAIGDSQNTFPVLLSGSATSYPFVTVLINDEVILKSASSVEVTFEDGIKVRKKMIGKGAIIPYVEKIDGHMSSSEVVIFDSEDNVLYASLSD